jgi:hypothetical protein
LVRSSCRLWNDCQNDHLVKQRGCHRPGSGSACAGAQMAVRPADQVGRVSPVLSWIPPNKRQPRRQRALKNASARESGGSPLCRAALRRSPTNKPQGAQPSPTDSAHNARSGALWHYPNCNNHHRNRVIHVTDKASILYYTVIEPILLGTRWRNMRTRRGQAASFPGCF